MQRIDKEIMINAPLEKIFNYIQKPSSLTQVWPSLMVVKNEQLLPNGGYSFEYAYKMAGIIFEGTGEYSDIAPNSWLTVKTKGAIESTITFTFRSKENQTRVTFTVDYSVPLPILSWLSGKIAIAMNEQEAELILNNLRAMFEEISKR